MKKLGGYRISNQVALSWKIAFRFSQWWWWALHQEKRDCDSPLIATRGNVTSLLERTL